MTDAERAGLEGEVVTHDCYRVQRLDFRPGVVYDFGANVGTFTKLARSLWPEALIICVEPDAENLVELRRLEQVNDANKPMTVVIPYAVGKTPVYKQHGAANGAMQCYMPAGVGYPAGKMAGMKTDIGLVMPYDVMTKGGLVNALVKMDIEGAEHAVFSDEDSMRVLRAAEYLCMEVHRYAADGSLMEEVREHVNQALASFERTHDCEQDGVMFYARKKR